MYKFLLVVLSLPLSLSLSGCYYLQAARGQMSLVMRREPITAVVNRPNTDAVLKQRLQEVQAARRFASEELALPDNRAYTTYVALPRDYVIWNVFATPELSVRPVQWCFPVAGCVVYRGYFSEAAAQKHARQLRLSGFDAAVSGVPAYSTLGHFDDPVVSSMMRYGDSQLAATLFHELAHQVAYAPGETTFNEAFATAVENEGLERWLSVRDRSDEWRRVQLQERRQREFRQLLLATRADLQRLYAQSLSDDDKRQRKQQRLGQLKFEYQQLKARWRLAGIASNSYDSWFNRTLSNADFIAIATYEACVPRFARLLAAQDHDLPRFYVAVQQLIGQRRQREFCQGAETDP